MATDEFVVDFPTLWVTIDWIEAHCVVPDGSAQGQPMELYPWQLWCTANHYRVKPTAQAGQKSTAFHYRRSQIIMPQKTGKGPWGATITLAEAAGPTVFDGFAGGGEFYDCAEFGCECGWRYIYEPGEPMAVPQTTPLIQLLATSEQQVANVFRPLQSMIKNGPLVDLMRVGEEFIRVGDMGRIDKVTSSATSRLGNPITFALQDETGIYTETNKMVRVAETMRRGLAGMGGRSMETTNPWDPSEVSTARKTHESKTVDVFKFFPQAPAGLSYKDKAQRRKIHAVVYAGSTHIDLDAIEGEAAELMETDPSQAERFFGNRIVAGTNAWVDGAQWDAREAPREVKPRTRIVLGFDGSDLDDWTGFRAETMTGYQFTPTYGPNRLPTIWNPADYGGQVPRLEVDAALDELMRRYDVAVLYADPPYWETEVDNWADRYGERKVIRWQTRRVVQMHAACERLKTDIAKAATTFSHDGCSITTEHVKNARAAARPQERYVLRKASQSQKIDMCVTSILAHEAAGDIIAAGKASAKKNYYYGT
ncbi:hypothetical protein ACFPA8_08010 [Streptomyces ovatisporus]|uniref:Terminase n=1 Tax=Streptomyces ovatisporus TaxID=1128682 RepID=A0ABV9A592_9ACTN